MTLSMHNHPPTWDRRLPKLPELVPQVVLDGYSRRNSSLLQHHITSKQRLNAEENGYARRSTVACIPLTRSPPSTINLEQSTDTTDDGPHSNTAETLGPLTRKRHASVMSIETGSRSSSPSSTTFVEGSHFCLCQPEPKIPRPRNAFILYRQHQHNAIVAQNPGLPNPDISKIIGEQWRLLPEKAKDEWKALAEEEKTRHSQQYPDYRYKPKRSSKHNIQSSTSGPSSGSATEAQVICQKCGGKTMNPPPTPYTPNTPIATEMPQMVGINPSRQQAFPPVGSQFSRPLSGHPIISPPHSGRVRPYGEVFGQPQVQRQDPRIQYPPGPQQNSHVVVSPDAKRRRFNSSGVYVPNRGVYPDHPYRYPPQDMVMGPPPRAGPVHQPPPQPMQHIQVRPPQPPTQMQQHLPQKYQQQHRQQDSNLTLPPLQTTQRPRASSQSAAAQTQKSGIEAMIMSIPVLNKLKILSQIAPQLVNPGPASPPQEVRGAILAIEGMDATSVMSMTNSLAEQLERDGKFAVRIFGGPDPYALLNSSGRANDAVGAQTLSNLDFLKIISEWHSINKEMVHYITHKLVIDQDKTPTSAKRVVEIAENVYSVGNGEGITEQTPPPVLSMDYRMKNSPPRPRTPSSAISPKTILQTSELSLKSPPIEVQNGGEETTRRKSRIPAAALAMQVKAQAEAKALSEAKAQAEALVHSQAQSEAKAQEQAQQTISTSQGNSAKQTSPTSSSHTRSGSPGIAPIPIALVPHYQLTTVDASSISMPITDAYSPHSHWQWLATLWRGCVGADVTVVISNQTDDTDGSMEETRRSHATMPNTNNLPGSNNNNNNNTSSTPASTANPASNTIGTGVEVRLLDCRAVLVRLGGIRDGTGRASNAGLNGRKDGIDAAIAATEAWEKAKRRVGFEVEEFLRR